MSSIKIKTQLPIPTGAGQVMTADASQQWTAADPITPYTGTIATTDNLKTIVEGGAGRYLLDAGTHTVSTALDGHALSDVIIEGKPEFKNTQRRKEGYLQALCKYNIDFSEELSVIGNYDLDGGYVAMKEILSLKNLPTAVFCFNDDMAVGAMKTIHEIGLRIPEDISIVGFDDSEYAAYLNPNLTSVSRPIEQMCIEGARILLEKIDGNKQKNKTIFLKTELKERDSARKL